MSELTLDQAAKAAASPAPRAQAPRLLIRKVAVLGAGVMGAQIAAHLVNANVEPLLFELPAKEGDPNGNVSKALDGLKKLEPEPARQRGRRPRRSSRPTTSSISHLLRGLRPHHRGHRRAHGLEEGAVSRRSRRTWRRTRSLPPTPRACRSTSWPRRCPRRCARASAASTSSTRRATCSWSSSMPPRHTDAAMLDHLETFLTTTLGKGVVRAKDTPNFIANRVGVFSMLATMHHTTAFGLGFDVVDALTGPAIGRAKSATFRTADVVGLDTMAHVVKTMDDTLPDDPVARPTTRRRSGWRS